MVKVKTQSLTECMLFTDVTESCPTIYPDSISIPKLKLKCTLVAELLLKHLMYPTHLNFTTSDMPYQTEQCGRI